MFSCDIARAVSRVERDWKGSKPAAPITRNSPCLLRQPHGFEGFPLLLIKANPDDRPVTARPHQAHARYRLDSVASAYVTGLGHHHMVTRLDELVWFDANRLEGFREVAKERPHLIELVDARVGADAPRPVEFGVRSRVFQCGI